MSNDLEFALIVSKLAKLAEPCPSKLPVIVISTTPVMLPVFPRPTLPVKSRLPVPN